MAIAGIRFGGEFKILVKDPSDYRNKHAVTSDTLEAAARKFHKQTGQEITLSYMYISDAVSFSQGKQTREDLKLFDKIAIVRVGSETQDDEADSAFFNQLPKGFLYHHTRYGTPYSHLDTTV